MLDIKLVTAALAGSGMDATSVALDETLRLSQSGELREAGEKASLALRDGVTDIRVIVAFLLGYFEERGPKVLPEILQTGRLLLTDGFAVLRPTARKPRVVDSALTLLFRGLRAAIHFRHAKRDATWKTWADSIQPDTTSVITAAADALTSTITSVLENPVCTAELLSLRTRAAEVFQRAPAAAAAAAPAAAPAPAPVTASASASAPDSASASASAEAVFEDEADEPPDEDMEPTPPSDESAPASPRGPTVRTIEVSVALESFMRKLEAFEVLVARGDMGKAAIIAQDVRKIVERFDPRVYLPALLAPHFRLLSTNIGQIAPFMGAEGDPAWQAMEQLYQVDLDAFVTT